MEEVRNSSLWLEEGYSLFARRGMGGIQIERLARIVKLNKSGFYHYFGDIEGYLEALLDLHRLKALTYLEDIRSVRNIDPDYLQFIVKHKEPVMFQVQLLRAQSNPLFSLAAQAIDRAEEEILRFVWSKYIDLPDSPAVAIRYFSFVRDMFYTRMSLQNMTFQFLQELMAEARDVMRSLADMPYRQLRAVATKL